MSVQKIFTDRDKRQLTASINDDLCLIQVGYLDDAYFNGFVQLDSDDLLELINELVYIREQMQKD